MLERVNDFATDIRHRSQHIRSTQEIRSRQNEAGLIAHPIPEKQNVEIHASRRPLRSMTLSATHGLDALQFGNDLAHRQVGIECCHEVDEIVALEACGDILVGRRKLDSSEFFDKFIRSQAKISLGIDVASRRHEYSCHEE